ncbi:excinuclease ABC subunit UvrC [Patescibacteria group bacterium]|nr:excinuclease ABC subunit UvrC [Patescibacteria group bacterium]MBU1702937.1 excinuclease ABC subunit UvrC [Patescibacteria group bacterium]MBU1953829.1 excinuclease ABC subunit UvrC [Patescibacteria group bacterium]
MKKQDRQKYLAHILKNLPRKPGVYKFKDEKGSIIYIGKAKDLKNRVSSYFQASKDQSVKTQKMISQIADIDFIVVDSDLEAIMLETNMIKKFRPKYNILMKDDKNYVYIKVTINEDFPRILITRRVDKDKARYFGPKTAQHKVQKTLKVLKRIFPYRHCSLAIDYQMPIPHPTDTSRKHQVKVTKVGIKYPCIDYHIKRCIGPCIGTVNKEEYREIIDQVLRFLEGKHDEIIKKLREDMQKAAVDRKFEIAAAIRDKLHAIEDIMETQRVSTPDQKDLDVINYFESDDNIYFNLSQVRGGKLINQENFEIKQCGDLDVLGGFLMQYYEKATDLPKEILIPHSMDDPDTLEKWLTVNKGGKVKIIIPQKGHKNNLLELSYQNAQNFAGLSRVKWQGHQKSEREDALEGLQKILKLEKTPKRLECYDISHFAGSQTVSSMVVFDKGFPKKDDYRKFKLHQEGSPDDFASMEETLERRLKYLKPSIESGLIKVFKSTKKELMKTKLKPNTAQFTIKKGKQKIGTALIFTSVNKKTLIQKIDIPADIDLLTVIKKIAQKTKTKRIYLSIPVKDTLKYEQIGCQPIAKIPDVFKIPASRKILVYDTTKHKTDSSFASKPDLIVIDGGKGQLSSALKQLKKYGFTVPIISIAKKNEEIYLPVQNKPIILSKQSPILHLIQHIRDESHRFALTYHQSLQMKATRDSSLDNIFGIGETTKMKLLKHFGSPQAIKNATMHELAQIIGKSNAKKIKQQL